MSEITAVAVPLGASNPAVLILKMAVVVPTFQIAGGWFSVSSYETKEKADAAIMKAYAAAIETGEHGILMVYEYAPHRIATRFYNAYRDGSK